MENIRTSSHKEYAIAMSSTTFIYQLIYIAHDILTKSWSNAFKQNTSNDFFFDYRHVKILMFSNI
jgi:hypothetical protein